MPYYRFIIDTSLTVDDACSRVKTITRAPRGFWEPFRPSRDETSHCEFIGSVEPRAFRLRRDIHYRNSFLPMIRGRVIESTHGTRIHVSMFLHPLVAVFMAFWLSGVGFGVLQNVSRAAGAVTIVPIGMLLFGLALMIGGFFPEALKAKRLLQESLESDGKNA